jgi:hypothetical protein
MNASSEEASVIRFQQVWTSDCRTSDGVARSTKRTLWHAAPDANCVATTRPTIFQRDGYESEYPTTWFVNVRQACASPGWALDCFAVLHPRTTAASAMHNTRNRPCIVVESCRIDRSATPQ